MNATERAETTFDRSLALLNALSRPKTEGRYGLHRSQNVFHPMMQLFQQDALQLPGNLLLRGVNARFRQQQTQIRILSLEPELLAFRFHLSLSRLVAIACWASRANG